jgi:cytochrome c oxidase assembly factor CtaG
MAAALLFPTWAYAHGVMMLWRTGSVGRGVARWQVAAFALGMFTLMIAMLSPLEAWSERLLAAHMVQHLLLIIVAPPLLVLGTPPSIFLWIFPLTWRRRLGRWFARPSLMSLVWRNINRWWFAWSIHAAALWLWHIPIVYEAAVIDPTVHMLEHISFFGTALLFWHCTLPQDQRRYLSGVFLIFTTALHSSILGALMTFSANVWYPVYEGRTSVWGLTALEDQQLAGLIMWIPAGVIYLMAMLALIGLWLQAMERAEQHPRAKQVQT